MQVPFVSQEPVIVPFVPVGRGAPDVTGCAMALQPLDAQPGEGDWTAGVYADGAAAVALQDLRPTGPGDYRLWVRVDAGDQRPVRIFPLTLTS